MKVPWIIHQTFPATERGREEKADENAEVFLRLLAPHRDRLHRVAFYMTDRGVNNADDLLQDALVTSFVAFRRLRRDNRTDEWLCRAVVNALLEIQQRAAVLTEPKLAGPASVDGEAVFDGRREPTGQEAPESLNTQIREALGRLPPALRLVLLLSDMEGMCYKVIAQTLRMRAGNVRSCVCQGRTMLREELKRDGCLPP